MQALPGLHPGRGLYSRLLPKPSGAKAKGPSIDGEAVLLGVDGRSDFNGLHSRKHDHEVEFYAFDILVSDGEDLRRLPLSMRKTSLARLLARRVEGIFLFDFEQGEVGPDLFRHACLMWSPSTAIAPTAAVGPIAEKVKNQAHPAFARGMDQWSLVNRHPPEDGVTFAGGAAETPASPGALARRAGHLQRAGPLPSIDRRRRRGEARGVINREILMHHGRVEAAGPIAGSRSRTGSI